MSNHEQLNNAFARAMATVQIRSGQLKAESDRRDYEGVGHTARQVVTIWLVGRALCRRLIECKEPSPYADGACVLLEEKYMALLALFEHAATTIAVPRMHRELSELRGTLVTAMAELLVESSSPARRSSR